MIKVFISSIILIATLVGAVLAQEGPPPIPPLPSPPPSATTPTSSPAETPEETPKETAAEVEEETYSLNFQGMNIDSLLKLYSEIAGVTVIKAANLTAQPITVISPVELSREEALKVLDATLDVNGLTVVKVSDKIYKVVNQQDAVSKGIETLIGEPPAPEDRMVTQILPLYYTDGSTLEKQLNQLVSKSGKLFYIQAANALVIVDTASNVRRLVDIIKQVDTELSTERVRIEVIPLKYADEKSVSQILEEIFQSRRTTTAPTPMSPRAPTATALTTATLQELQGKVKVIPDARLGAVIVITTERYFPLIKDLIEKLDIPGPAGQQTTRIYYLQNADAKDLAAVLQALFSGIAKTTPSATQTTARPTAGALRVAGLTGQVTIVDDERTNALIITTDPQNFSLIDDIIEKLDIRTPQVLIQAWLAEATYSSTVDIGAELSKLEHHFSGEDGLRYKGTISMDLGVEPGTLSYQVYKQTAYSALDAILSVYKRVGNVNLLSRPHILVSNNQEANIEVTTQVPIEKIRYVVGESATAGERERSIEYKDVGITLKVTPRISENRDVVLNLYFEVSAVGETDEVTGAHQFIKRNSETTVLVGDGDLLVIGGLLRTDDTITTTKVPLLGDIPGLGWLFRKHHDVSMKTELLVFIQPSVVTTREEGTALTESMQEKSKIESTPAKQEAQDKYEKALALYKAGDLEGAKSLLEETLKINPEHKDARKLLDRINDKLKEEQERSRKREAARKLDEARAQADAFYEEGLAFYRQRNYAKAAERFERALAVYPEHRSAKRYLDKAIKLLEEKGKAD